MSCSRTQHGGGRSRTPDLSLRSPTLYHWATALPSSTIKFTKSGFSVKIPLILKLHIRWSRTFVKLKEQFNNMPYRLSLLRLQLSSLKATVTHQKWTITSTFDFDLLRVRVPFLTKQTQRTIVMRATDWSLIGMKQFFICHSPTLRKEYRYPL